jgi:hypothetical protein
MARTRTRARRISSRRQRSRRKTRVRGSRRAPISRRRRRRPSARRTTKRGGAAAVAGAVGLGTAGLWLGTNKICACKGPPCTKCQPPSWNTPFCDATQECCRGRFFHHDWTMDKCGPCSLPTGPQPYAGEGQIFGIKNNMEAGITPDPNLSPSERKKWSMTKTKPPIPKREGRNTVGPGPWNDRGVEELDRFLPQPGTALQRTQSLYTH